MTSYLKGKDIKTKGDCLVYCFTRRIELSFNTQYHLDRYQGLKTPEGFEKW